MIFNKTPLGSKKSEILQLNTTFVTHHSSELMKDILETLFLQFPFDNNSYESVICGEKFIGIMLKNGSIGVASTLSEKMPHNILKALANPDFSNYSNRILVNAWVNACVNHTEKITGTGDIFEAISFNKFKNVVMVGYFGSLAQKFNSQDLELTIFDLNEHEKPVEPMENQQQYIEKADCVILTSTSIANGTFCNLISFIKENCKVYLLGPSTPLSCSVMELFPVNGIFGARFKPFDFEVLNAIEAGGGTRAFLANMQKVYILNE